MLYADVLVFYLIPFLVFRLPTENNTCFQSSKWDKCNTSSVWHFSPESAVDNLQVPQTASSSGVPPLSLSAPVVWKQNTLLKNKPLDVSRSPWSKESLSYLLSETSHISTYRCDYMSYMKELTLSLALLRVAALSARRLLQMVGLGSTTTAQCVRLVSALTEWWCSLGLRKTRGRSEKSSLKPKVTFKPVNVLSQLIHMNHRKSFVQTFVFGNIIDKTLPHWSELGFESSNINLKRLFALTEARVGLSAKK